MDKKLKREIRKNSNINSLILLLFYIFIFVFAIFAEEITALFVRKDSQNFYYVYKLIAYIFQYAVTVPVLLLIFKGLKKKDKDFSLKECFCKPQMPAGWVFKWIIIALGLSYAVSYVSSIVFSLIQMLTETELHSADFSADNALIDRIATILSITFLAPFFEELLFRATLYRNISKYGAWSMVIISGIIFGLWHGNYEQTLYTATLGMLSCFLIAKTKSFIPSLAVHFIMNLIGGIQALFIGSVDTENVMLSSNLGAVAVIYLLSMLIIGISIAGLVLFIIEVALHPESFRLENRCTEASTGKKLAVFFTAPLTILIFALMIFSTVFNAFNA